MQIKKEGKGSRGRTSQTLPSYPPLSLYHQFTVTQPLVNNLPREYGNCGSFFTWPEASIFVVVADLLVKKVALLCV